MAVEKVLTYLGSGWFCYLVFFRLVSIIVVIIIIINIIVSLVKSSGKWI